MTSSHERAAPDAPVLLSVGYEGRDQDELVALLDREGVDVVVDVRLTPRSRKPGLSKRRLGAALAEHGIDYRHEADLGNPAEARAAFHDDRLLMARRRYARRLDGVGRAAYERVLDLAATARVALLCIERDDARCHRWCLLERAQRDRPDLVVRHL